ncbi:MAG: branched-chain amino acid ABC transporter substrate-binding protein [Pseudomonadota bacterium]|nr:branched-chain amino acid ABC transporter substrate-binding protein [Pseudomonadota bacterium]
MIKLAASGIILAGLLFGGSAQAEIMIGLAGPTTGENAFLGEQMKHGAQQAITDINAQGGINGEKLALHFADDACDPKQAVAVANQMASAGVKFVIGHGCSGASVPASKVYAEENILMITPSATNPALTEGGLKNVFRVCGRDDQQGSAVGQYLLSHYAGKKIAILHNQSAWGAGIAQEVKRTINDAGVKEAIFEPFSPGERDYSALISHLKQAGVDAAFVGGFYTEVGLIVRQMEAQGAGFQVLGGDALVSKSFWAITGPAAEGVVMSFNPDPRKRPEAKTALESLRKSGFEPEGYTLYTYAAVQVIAEGIKRAGAPDSVKAAAAIRQSPVPTVAGILPYDAKGDVKGSNYVMYRWHNSNYDEIGE